MSFVPSAASAQQSFPLGWVLWERSGVGGILNIHTFVTGCRTLGSACFVLGTR